MSKGDARRPKQISPEEENIRWLLAEGRITFDEFERRFNQLLQHGKIMRSGQILSAFDWGK